MTYFTSTPAEEAARQAALRRANAMTFTARYLTPRELWRLLHRYGLPEVARGALLDDEAAYGDCLAEQAAERGVGYLRTPLDRYLDANPVHGCAPAPVVDDHDDVPF
jgi:hypothetical protein